MSAQTIGSHERVSTTAAASTQHDMCVFVDIKQRIKLLQKTGSILCQPHDMSNMSPVRNIYI